MKKKIFFLSILCLLFVTLSYTYSSFKNTIVGTITANVKDWVFKVSVDNGTIKDGGYNLHLSGTSGLFNVNINTNGSKSGADYTIELIGDSSIKFYTDSSYTKLINNNIYSGSINSNTSSSVTIYYKSDTAINSDILIKTKGTIMKIAYMKNGYSSDSSANGGTEFWSDNYKPYVRTITFGNDLGNLPSTCNEENLCWDISESATQKKKVYGYLVDTGLKDKTDNTKPLYNLYIVSEAQIFAPNDSSYIFSFYKYENSKYISNLISINFNDNFNTSNVTDMGNMFSVCSSLTSLDLSSFNTAKVTNMNDMFASCSSLTSLNLSTFDTSNVTDMRYMFDCCSSLTSLDLSNFNTANVTDMQRMFESCSSLTSLDLSSFNTANVVNMSQMFRNCSSLTTTINIMTSYINCLQIFYRAATKPYSQITLNYIADASAFVDKIIQESAYAGGSSGGGGSSGNGESVRSHVVKGVLISEPSITITGNDDIKYEANNRFRGSKVTLISISGNNYVTSFKMNGTTINGNEFIMNDNDVKISDIVTIPCKIIETAHYPYPDSQDNVILGEYTFEGAKSLTVILDYEVDNSNGDYFRIYDSVSSTTGINNNKKYLRHYRTKETITINSNYIKITFTSDDLGNQQYGLKAIIIPNY